MKILVINGPNLNFLGIREPEIYGATRYETLVEMIRARGAELGLETVFFQSNHEGALIDRIQSAYSDGTDGILINPAGFTTTSVAILDALKAVGLPAVEVHLSNIFEREAFRQDSLIRLACFATVVGKGIPGYFEGLALLKERLTEGKAHSETPRTS